jgi:RNA polymerase sigma factor (sigma-70 family)
LQNTFVKAWFAIDKFREESSLFTWLYRIATNEAIILLRRNKKLPLLSITGNEKTIESKFEAGKSFDADSINQKLQGALLQLPEKQRIVFTLRYYDEMKYEDMKNMLNTSTGALKASYHHAVRKIIKLMDSD